MASNLKIKQTGVSKVKSHRFLCNPYQASMSWCNCSNRVLTGAHNINSHKRQRSFSGLFFATATSCCQVKVPNIINIASSGTEKFHHGLVSCKNSCFPTTFPKHIISGLKKKRNYFLPTIIPLIRWVRPYFLEKTWQRCPAQPCNISCHQGAYHQQGEENHLGRQ